MCREVRQRSGGYFRGGICIKFGLVSGRNPDAEGRYGIHFSFKFFVFPKRPERPSPEHREVADEYGNGNLWDARVNRWPFNTDWG